jgi:hypothetical protein
VLGISLRRKVCVSKQYDHILQTITSNECIAKNDNHTFKHEVNAMMVSKMERPVGGSSRW